MAAPHVETPPERRSPAGKPGDGRPLAPPPAPAAPPVSPARRSRKRLLLIVLGVGLLGAAGVFAWLRFFPLHREEPNKLVLQGNVDVRQVNLGFKVEGRIAALNVDEGDPVHAGQVIGTLDKRYFEDDLRLARARRAVQAANLLRLENGSRPEEIAQARAQLAERKATLERAKQDFARARRLLPYGSIGQEDYDRAKAAVDEAEARLRSGQEALRLAEIGPREEDILAARAQLRAEDASIIQAERRLADADLLAPGDGVILTRAREVGAIVAPGETVFALTLTTPVWVRTYVAEPDLGRIRPGMPAEVRTDSAPNRPYRGYVGYISPVAEFTPKSVETRQLRTDLVYRVRIVVDNPDGGLRQGMPVTVTVDLSGGK